MTDAHDASPGILYTRRIVAVLRYKTNAFEGLQIARYEFDDDATLATLHKRALRRFERETTDCEVISLTWEAAKKRGT